MAFEIARSDGRSNQQVVIDLVKDKQPGTLFSYDVLVQALGLPKERARSAVLLANRRLLREHKRVLTNVRGQGYRMALANEHMEVAHSRRRSADKLLKRGVEVLENVRFEELDDSTREIHRGNLLVFQGLYQAMRGHEERLQRIEDIIANHA